MFKRGEKVALVGLNRKCLNGKKVQVIGVKNEKVVVWDKPKAYQIDPSQVRKITTLHDEPEIFVIDDFFSEEECSTLINLHKELPKHKSKGGHCTSTKSNIKFEDVPFVAEKVCRIVGMESRFAEGFPNFQIAWYGIGDEFKKHHDGFSERNLRNEQEQLEAMAAKHGKRLDEIFGASGQRTWTAMIYLNHVEKGGETRFLNVGVEVKPKTGRLCVWENVKRGTFELHPDSLHAGLPVLEGEKYIAVVWFREKPNDKNVDG